MERDPSIVAGSSTTANRDSQYVTIKYTERLADAGIEPSVGSGGDSYDNTLAV
jgi:transposase InsO family protein